MAAATATHSAEVLEVRADTTDPVRVPTATVVPLAWDREVEGFEAGEDAAAVAGADEWRSSAKNRLER